MITMITKMRSAGIWEVGWGGVGDTEGGGAAVTDGVGVFICHQYFNKYPRCQGNGGDFTSLLYVGRQSLAVPINCLQRS